LSILSNSEPLVENQVGGLSITVYHDLASVEMLWRELCANGISTVFQNFDWCNTWFKVWGQKMKCTPLVVVARKANHQIAFILPMQRRNWLGLTLLEWMGQPQFSYSGGIFANDFLSDNAAAWFEIYVPQVIEILRPNSLFNLRNMPAKIQGVNSPLSGLFALEAVNISYVMTLNSSFETLLKTKRTAKSLSKMRRRDVRLQELGDLQYTCASESESATAIIDACLAIKNEQLRASGVKGLFENADAIFYKSLLVSAPNSLDVFYLQLNGETLSVMIGAHHAGQFLLLISAFNSAIAAQLSPGDHLLRKVIAHCCEQNYKLFDFSLGDQDYKTTWQDEKVVSYHFIRGETTLGSIAAFLLRLNVNVKRSVKQSAVARKIYTALRSFIFGSKTERT
jgi:CelD/BcsL family acetyltransferase involved in cellulose biosynthesis